MSYDTAIAIILGSIIFTWGYLSVNMSKEHGLLQVVYMFLSIGTIVTASLFMIEISDPSVTGYMQTYYLFVVFALILMGFYFGLALIINMFERFGILNPSGKSKSEKKYEE